MHQYVGGGDGGDSRGRLDDEGEHVHAVQVPGVVITPPAGMPPGAAPPAPAAKIPWLGLTAVLLGTFISTLNTRLSNFGLADIRGAVHAGFDDGAWILAVTDHGADAHLSDSHLDGYRLRPPESPAGSRRGLAVIALIEPFSPNLPMLLGLQFMEAWRRSFFVPLTLSYVLRNMPPKYWAYGIALYALNLEVSLNISASFEGWYVDHLSWRWIFWQQVPMANRHGAVPEIRHPPGRSTRSGRYRTITALLPAASDCRSSTRLSIRATGSLAELEA